MESVIVAVRVRAGTGRLQLVLENAEIEVSGRSGPHGRIVERAGDDDLATRAVRNYVAVAREVADPAVSLDQAVGRDAPATPVDRSEAVVDVLARVAIAPVGEQVDRSRVGRDATDFERTQAHEVTCLGGRGTAMSGGGVEGGRREGRRHARVDRGALRRDPQAALVDRRVQVEPAA